MRSNLNRSCFVLLTGQHQPVCQPVPNMVPQPGRDSRPVSVIGVLQPRVPAGPDDQ